MYHRKNLAWASALILSLGLVACGGGGDSNDDAGLVQPITSSSSVRSASSSTGTSQPSSSSSTSSAASSGASMSSAASSTSTSTSASSASTSSTASSISALPGYTVSTRYTWGGDASTLFPAGLALDSAGNFYVAMNLAGRVDKISAQGSEVVASGLQSPHGLAFNSAAGNAFVLSDEIALALYQLGTNGTRMLLAGSGPSGNSDGVGTAARFMAPRGVAFDSSSHSFYIADMTAHTIRKLDSRSTVSTFAGSGLAGNSDGNGTAATFDKPVAVAVDGQGNVYVAEYGNNQIRKITPAGVVTKHATGINRPTALAATSEGRLFVCASSQIIAIDPDGSRNVVAGNSTSGTGVDGPGASANFGAYSHGILYEETSGKIYVADSFNGKLRVLTPSR